MPEPGWHERMEALLSEQGRTPEVRVAALSFHVPSGYLFMDAAEVNRIHNECEALRIERDAARDAIPQIVVALREEFRWTDGLASVPPADFVEQKFGGAGV